MKTTGVNLSKVNVAGIFNPSLLGKYRWLPDPPDVVDQQYAYSELDTDYKKYGYKIIVDPSQHLHNQVRWENENTGLTQEKCSDIAANLMTQSYQHKKYRAGSFGFPEVAEFLDPDTVLKTPVADYASLFSTWRNEKKEQYITRLFESFK
jgi:hypothetical protein